MPMNKFMEEDKIDYNKLSLGELQDILEEKYEFLSKDKRTKEYQKLKEEYNHIVLIYNTIANDQIYRKIK